MGRIRVCPFHGEPAVGPRCWRRPRPRGSVVLAGDIHRRCASRVWRSPVISNDVLTLTLWLVIAAWTGTAFIILVEFHSKNRHDARSAQLLDQLTTSALFAA